MLVPLCLHLAAQIPVLKICSSVGALVGLQPVGLFTNWQLLDNEGDNTPLLEALCCCNSSGMDTLHWPINSSFLSYLQKILIVELPELEFAELYSS